MREIKITDLITKSSDRTGMMLFKPFSASKWLKLLLIAFLAGALPGGCGSGGGSHSEKKAQASPSVVREEPVSNEATVSVVNVPSKALDPKAGKEQVDKLTQAIADRVMALPPGIMIAVLGGVVFLVLGFLVFCAWLGARFRFVWFDAIVHNRQAIAEPFRRYKKEGDSLFKLWLAVGLGFLFFAGSWIVVVMTTLSSVNFFKGGEVAKTGGAIVILIAAFLLFFAAMITLAIWSVVVDHFVTVIMATDRIPFRPAWRKFWAIYQANVKDLWLYLLVTIGLGIVISIAEGVILFILLIALVIAGLVIFGLLYLLFAMMQAKVVFWVAAVVLGIPAGLAALSVLAAVGLPFAVFFRNFSLYYFTSLNCGYAPLSLSNKECV